jgi:hypothetical protein
MRKKISKFLYRSAVIILTIVCIGMAYNVLYGSGEFVSPITDANAEAFTRIRLPSAVVLLGETIKPDSFLAETSGEFTAVFNAPIETHSPGKREVSLSLFQNGDKSRTLHGIADVYILEPNRFVEQEAGSDLNTIKTMEFIANGDILDDDVLFDFDFITDIQDLNINETGWHDIRLALNGAEFTATLKVTKTTPPVFLPVDVTIGKGQAVSPHDFVKEVEDSTPVTVFYKLGHEPDIYTAGEQYVTVILEDKYGNSVESRSLLYVLPNRIPPIINGTRDLDLLLGGTAIYRQGVTAEDAFGNPLEFTIENNVDLSTPGEYTATYIAVDGDGNRTEQTIKVTVLEIQEEMLNDKLQAITDRIIREGMTQREMAEAIYIWVLSNVGYVSDAPKGSVYEGAFRALHYRSGDCFTYYAISEVLLTRVGIPNMRIERIEGTPTRHYWNLVNADDAGWYHFDTTPVMIPGLNRFMFTQSKAEEYTRIMWAETRTREYYTYDPSKYPVEVVP